MQLSRKFVAAFAAVVVFVPSPCQALFKRWIRNVNYQNAGNWDAGRLPCENDNVTIPESSPIVYLQHDTALLELVLPLNGEIVLGDSVSLSFGPALTPQAIRPGADQKAGDVPAVCRGKALTFNRTHPMSWFDPTNWCTTETETGPCLPTSVIDAERVPCEHDDVIFPTGATYHVDMDTSDDITIGRLKIRGKYLSEEKWGAYVASDSGKKEFIRTKGFHLPDLKIKQEVCDDVTGCKCGNDEMKILHKICAIQKHRCLPLMCEKPLTPQGACCRLCGAQLNIEYGIGFSIDHLRKLIKDTIMPANASLYSDAGVTFTASKVAPRNVQVIVTDASDGSAALFLAQQLNGYVMSEDNRHLYSVKTVTVRQSEVPARTDPYKSGLALDISVIVAICVSLLVLLLLVILIAVYVHKRRRGDAFFQFSRFFGSGKSRDIELTTPSVSYVDVLGATDSGRGFDNPLYGSSPLGKVFPIDDSMEFYQDPAVKFNPTFSADGIDQDSTI